MKKKLAILLCAALTGSIGMTGTTVSAEGTENSVKTGLALITDLTSSKDAKEDKDGTGQSDVAIAAVTVDEKGVIVRCIIDAAQTKISFDAEGRITADPDDAYPTKLEKGDDYGMRPASAIEKEWYEQAGAFADYCVGKTAEEIAGMAVTESGAAEDADLAASCSIKIAPLQNVVVKAAENAVEGGASAADRLGLGVVTTAENSKDASADKDGMTEAYSTVAAITLNEDGVITSASVDAVQARVYFDAEGIISDATPEETLTKLELGEDYGMKPASGIGKEWYEQAQAYVEYCMGKTAEEISGIAVTEAGKAEDTDLAASVTIGIVSLNEVIAKAAASAE